MLSKMIFVNKNIVMKIKLISKYFLFFILSFFTPLFAISQGFNLNGKSVAFDRDVNDKFGNSVSISGNYAVVGSPMAEHPLFGSLVQSGAAYIYEKNSSGIWTQIQKIQPQFPSDQERDFGWSVSISGNNILVGCPGALKDENGLNQISGGGGNIGVGAAFIFKRNSNGIWQEVQKIVASDRTASDQFGQAVDISGGRAIIGACWEDDDENGGNTKDYAGSAYIFEQNNSGYWNEVQKIVASDRDVHDKFGWSVSIELDYAIVGAIWENSGIANNGSGGHEGAVYVFKRQSIGNWNEIQKIKHSDVEWMDHFGYSVSLSGDYFVAGAPKNPNDNFGSNHISASGGAYIFKKNSFGTFIQTQKIVASDRSLDDNFGEQVEISGNNLVVGAPQEDHDNTGGNFMTAAGSIYIFNKTSLGNWIETQKEAAFDRATGDGFGWSLAISGNDIIVGAPTEDHDVFGGNYMKNAGSVYILGQCLSTSGTINPNVCNSYTSPSGILYTSSGTYTDIISNSNGCDSIITIHLTINTASSSIINETTCNSYTSSSGITYTSSGTYYETLTNGSINGCDSIITLNLIINVANVYAGPSQTVCLGCTEYSIEFDGIGDYVTFGNPANLRVTGDFSISAWVKFTGSGTYYIYTGADMWGLLTSGNKIRFLWRNPAGTYLYINSTTSVSDGAWHHVLAVNDQTNLKIFIDGVADGTNTNGSAGKVDATKDYRMGTRYNGTYGFPGNIDEVAIWNNDQSANVAAIYGGGAAADLTSLSPLAWWRNGDNNGGVGTTLTDEGSGGNNGTLVNNATFDGGIPVDSVVLFASGAQNYSWNNGVVDGVYFTPSATTLYTVSGTDANGCTGTDTVTIFVGSKTCIAVTLSGLDSVFYSNYTYYQSGHDTIYHTNVSGCDSIEYLTITVNHTGINENVLKDVNIYPNPTSDIINIKGLNSLNDVVHIHLFDNKGSLIKKMGIKETKINLSSLSTGMYFIEIKHQLGSGRIKVMKQ